MKKRNRCVLCGDADEYLLVGEKINSTPIKREEIVPILNILGLSTHLLGYNYVIEAIQIASKSNGSASICWEIYPKIAKKYNTTASKVERNIRYIIEKAWMYTNNIDYRFVIFGNSIDKRKPTNKEFIIGIINYLSLDPIVYKQNTEILDINVDFLHEVTTHSITRKDN